MARISGVNVPTGKRVEIALTYIYGIGRSTASKIMDEAGIPRSRRVNDLTEVELDTSTQAARICLNLLVLQAQV